MLAGHPTLTTEVAAGGARAGEALSSVQPHLMPLVPAALASAADAAAAEVDVLFSCLPSGTSKDLLDRARAVHVVDLADDHRDAEGWAYGLTEFAREQLGHRVANPGCYPTASLLGLLPFAAAGVIEGPIIIDGMSGASGAGRAPADHLGFAYLSGSACAYGTTEHRHIAEMERGLRRFGGLDTSVSFTPHLLPMARGLLTTARAGLTGNLSDAEAMDILEERYADEAFVHVTEGWPQTKAVAGTNHALVHARIDARNSLLVCSVAIDNLGKGAAGQAIQNANLLLGLEETLGLEGVAVWP